MANIKSQKKRVLTNAKATARNKSVKSAVDTARKKPSRIVDILQEFGESKVRACRAAP